MKTNVIKLMCLLCLLVSSGLVSFDARAYTLDCQSFSATLNPPLPNPLPAAPNSTIYKGQLSISISCRTVGGGGLTPYYMVPSFPSVGAAIVPTSISGVYVSTYQSPTYANTNISPNCGKSLGPGGSTATMGGVSTSYTSFASGFSSILNDNSMCGLNVTYYVQLTTNATPGSGTLNSSNLLSSTFLISNGYTTPLGPCWINFLSYPNTTTFISPTNTCFNTTGANTTVNPVICTATVNSNQTVTLPDVGTNLLNGVGKTAGKKAFPIALTSCNNPANAIKTATATWSFPSGSGPISTTIANSAASKAPDVFVQLLDSNGNAIDGTTGNANNITTIGSVPASGGSVTPATYYAQYYSNSATPGAGDVSATATFMLNYN